MRALVELRDKGGRLWLLAVVGDPTLVPGDGNDAAQASLHELVDRDGRVTVSGFKVIRDAAAGLDWRRSTGGATQA